MEKKNKEIGLVVDYRQINSNILDEIIQIPRLHDSIRMQSGNHWHGQIDLKNGFNRLELSPNSRKLTGF